MSNVPLISIVIPVYNVEKYLRQCLDSVVNQTHRNIQIICVNDGSPDNSHFILQEYANKDSRIEIIDKPNGGLSSARNAAYPFLKGKYTLFVDSDDWIDFDLCLKTYRKAEENRADITLFFFDTWKESKLCRFSWNDKSLPEKKMSLFDFPSACCKLWSTRFLLENALTFPCGLVYEDNLVNWKAVTLANRITVAPYRLYHYRTSTGSITQTWNNHALDLIPIYNLIGEYLRVSGFYAKYRDKYLSMKLDVWYRHYRHIPTELQARYIEMIRGSLTMDDRDFYQTASKSFCKPLVKSFYMMIDGDRIDGLKFQAAYRMNQIMRLPEVLVNRWIVKPLRQRRDAV